MRRGRIGRLAHQEKCVNFESLNGREVRLDFKLWKDDHLIASIGSCMTDYDQSIDMALWQQTERNFCHVILAARLSHRISVGLLERRYLQHV